jgi:manganese transport protein
MRRLVAVAFWSIIAAAFIGPGTVTTCAKAGAGFGYRLLWALTFSTVATLVLQEASGRLTVTSGRSLGEALRHTYRGGAGGAAVLLLVLGAIVVGCAAYEAGNVLGAVAGLGLATGVPPLALTLACGLAAGVLLWLGSPRGVALGLSGLVALMGVAFLVTALLLRPPLGAVLGGAVWPALPAGSGLLVLGLVGTTVVPYNLFLGSGLARGQVLGEMRFGLGVAVVLGGLISMGVMVVGAAVAGPFGFEAVGQVLAGRLGGWAAVLFASGLAAAGLSSAITAPLAAALTAAGLFGGDGEAGRWGARSWRYRSVWGAVLATGIGFAAAGVSPIPAILLAQAFNGVLLPFVAVFLLLAVNDRRLMAAADLNGAFANAVTVVVVLVSVVLGLSSLARAAAGALGLPPLSQGRLLAGAALAALALALPIARTLRRRRRPPAPGGGAPPAAR